MTADEKRERRTVRHGIHAAAKQYAVNKFGLMSTSGTLNSLARTMTDRFIAMQVSQPNSQETAQ